MFNAVFIEKRNDSGLNSNEVIAILAKFGSDKDCEFIPLEIQGEYSSALGFIRVEDADRLEYMYEADDPFYKYVQSILKNMDLETPNGEYDFDFSNGAIHFLLTRNI